MGGDPRDRETAGGGKTRKGGRDLVGRDAGLRGRPLDGDFGLTGEGTAVADAGIGRYGLIRLRDSIVSL